MPPRICIIKYRRIQIWTRKHHLKLIFSMKTSSIECKNTFALNWIFGPKGSPGQTTEESAAHHFLLKTFLNIPEKSFSKGFSTLAVCRESVATWAKIPGNGTSKFHNFRSFLHESASSNIEEFKFQSEIMFRKWLCHQKALAYMRKIHLRWTGFSARRAPHDKG